jgi:hypothetical protein
VPSHPHGYIFALFHTASDAGVHVLSVRRHLVRTRVDGKTTRGDVPNWAGQWGLIAARPLVTQPVEQTVQGAVLAQTGIDLSAADSAERYRVIRTETRTLSVADAGAIEVLLLTCLPEGLDALAADAQTNLDARRVDDGVLAAAEVQPIGTALSRVAPCATPDEGWERFLANHGLAEQGGLLDRLTGGLAQRLAERSAMPPTGAQAALDILAALAIPQVHSDTASARLAALNVLGARSGSAGDWYQTWSPGEMVLIQAVTEPPAAAVAWDGGATDPLGRADWRAVGRDNLSDPGAPFLVRAGIAGAPADEQQEVRVAVIPELVGVEVEGVDGDGSVRVRALLAPADQRAAAHLRWNGGVPEPGDGAVRRLSASELAAGERLSLTPTLSASDAGIVTNRP